MAARAAHTYRVTIEHEQSGQRTERTVNEAAAALVRRIAVRYALEPVEPVHPIDLDAREWAHVHDLRERAADMRESSTTFPPGMVRTELLRSACRAEQLADDLAARLIEGYR